MTKIGNLTIEVDAVTWRETRNENGSWWLIGEADVNWIATTDGNYPGASGSLVVPVGCWTDTDDDNDSWSCEHEGARIIERCFGGPGPANMAVRAAFCAYPQECQDLGQAVCDLLRAASLADNHCVSPD